MKRLDRVILMEILGPWLFGVAMFSVLIFAGNYLFQISQFAVGGAGIGRVMELTALLMPSVIIKTFPMALLLAGLLGFGRLSSDSEITAMRAAGTSILRMMRPVAAFSVVVAIFSFFLNEAVVPPATFRALELRTGIVKELKDISVQELAAAETTKDGKPLYLVSALRFDLTSKTMQGVTITTYDKAGEASFVLVVPMLRYQSEKNWRIIGGGKLVTLSESGGYSVNLHGDAWPPEVPEITKDPRDLLSQDLKQLDALNLQDMAKQIEQGRNDAHISRKQLANLEYGYWNKFALPLAALVYGLLGAPLGIRNARTGAATGFALSVAIIFAYITLANFMSVIAQGGAIPAYLASFTPLAIGLIAAGVIIWRRNG